MYMRIGILTFHCAHNYGAMLQCYALQEYLKGWGDEVYVIDGYSLPWRTRSICLARLPRLFGGKRGHENHCG